MNKLVLACGFAAALAASPAFAQSNTDKTFIRDVIQGNLAEIQIGKLAQERGASDGVRSFGQMLVTDHTENNAKATQVAEALKVTRPTEPNAKQRVTFNRLARLSGTAFDRAFASDMVADHKEDIAKFEQEQKSKDPTVASFAGETLPTLHKHLDAAQNLAKAGKATVR